MNLTELRSLLANTVDYGPNTDPYLVEIDQLLNSSLATIWAAKEWNFAQRTAQVPVYADDTTAELTATGGSTAITTTSAFFLSWHEGQVAQIEGVEYEIAEVTSTTAAYLRTAFEGSTGANKEIIIKHRFIDMPADCVRVLQAGFREIQAGQDNTGRLSPLTLLEDEELGLAMSQTGTPTHWLPADPAVVPAPAPTPTISTGVGTWPTGAYSFKVAHKYAGRVSGLNTTALSGTSVGAANQFALTLANNGTGSGYRYQIYCKPPGYTAYRLLRDDIDETGGTQVLNNPPGAAWQFEPRHPGGHGVVQRVRLYPRQDQDRMLTVRYQRAAPVLIEAHDSTEIPAPYGKVVANFAAGPLLRKKAQWSAARIADDLAEQDLTSMGKQFITQTPRHWVKGSAWDGQRTADFFANKTLVRTGP